MAEYTLIHIKSSFVEKVSQEVIGQLLDDLHGDGVLNRREMLSFQMNMVGDARAGELIDTVVKKGDEASRKMIHYLQKRDPELHSTLGLEDELAVNKLHRIKSSFVENVSQEVIKQLLDDLHGDGVLNRREMLSFQMNMVGAARAGELIDTVLKKGDEASRKMIHQLQKRDPELSSKLGLEDELAVAQPQQEQQWSTQLLPSSDTFWREKKNDPRVYPVSTEAIRSRVALLITNIKFTDPRYDRHGAERDEENMEKHLKSLGYEVVKHTNLTGKAINDAVIKFSKHPKLKGTDSVVVVIMSHGVLGAVCGVEWTKEKQDDKFPIDNIYKHLGPESCPALLNKPKIIIIQACRGEEKGSVAVKDDGSSVVSDAIIIQSASEVDIEGDAVKHVHQEKDFISLLSSTPDALSYRDTSKGSFLIQYVVEVFNTFACQEHIEELFRLVMERFEEFASGIRRQMPTKDRCTLTRHFYFFPGQ